MPVPLRSRLDHMQLTYEYSIIITVGTSSLQMCLCVKRRSEAVSLEKNQTRS